MAEPGICPQCETRLPADAPHGVCPKCMLGLGLSDSPDLLGAAALPTQDTGGRFAAPTTESLKPHFPQLEILELLGQGGMGTVYKARQTMLDRTVALKILPPEVGSDPAFAERFTREAQALAKLAHPNIVMVFDFGESNGYYYFVMEYVDGINLRQSLQLGHVSAEEALAIIPQICDALQYAHDEGIVHRDIKPENVLLDRRGRVKIADFGLAKLVGATQSGLSLTGTQQVMGTPHYMAPEQMERPASVDHRADIYSLGVVFYELLTGELPLGRFAPPSKKSEATAELDKVVLRTLEKEPELRYQRASELKTAVETLPPEPTGGPQRVPPVIDAPKIRVPFSIGDVYGGFAKAEGILRFDGEQLLFQFRVKDEFVGVVSSGIKNINVPVADILTVELRSGWFSYTLEIFTDHLDSLHEIPRSEPTRAKLQIAKRDVTVANQLVHEVNRTLGRPTPDRPVAAAHPLPFAEALWSEADLSEAKREVRAPGNGLLTLGILNCIAPFLLLALIIPVWTLQTSTPGQAHPAELPLPNIRVERIEDSRSTPGQAHTVDIPSPSIRIEGREGSPHKRVIVQHATDHAFPMPTEMRAPMSFFMIIIVVASLATMLPLAIIMILGGVRMKQLDGYGLSVFASVAAILPFHPLFLFGIPVGIWSLVVLGRRRTKMAFRQNGRMADRQLYEQQSPAKEDAGPTAKPVTSALEQDVLSRVRGPAIGLIVAGALNTIVLLVLLASVGFGPVGMLERLILAIPCLVGLVQLRCGIAMYGARSYGMSMAGAVASILPLSATWLFGAAFGVWAIVVLQRPDVKELYAEREGS